MNRNEIAAIVAEMLDDHPTNDEVASSIDHASQHLTAHQILTGGVTVNGVWCSTVGDALDQLSTEQDYATLRPEWDFDHAGCGWISDAIDGNTGGPRVVPADPQDIFDMISRLTHEVAHLVKSFRELGDEVWIASQMREVARRVHSDEE